MTSTLNINMSTAMSWLLIGALVIVVLFCINAAAYRLRYGTFLRGRKGEHLSPTNKLSNSEMAIGIFFCLALLIALGVPVAAPTSSFAAWLREPYALVVYAVWCWFIAVLIGAGPKVFALLRGKSDV